MKVLVAYMSKTGNTRKIAEAIYGEIAHEKEIKKIEDVEDIGAYDFAFLGFPMRQLGPDKTAKEFMQKHCRDGRKVALFVTHAAPEGPGELSKWLEGFKQAASGAELVGMFDCQGQLASGVKFMMRLAPNKEFRRWAKMDNSKGQPDAIRVDKAREFARGIMGQLG